VQHSVRALSASVSHRSIDEIQSHAAEPAKRDSIARVEFV